MDKKLIIVGGGHSLIGKEEQISNLFPLNIIVGVNDACYYLPCDFGVSMDRLWTENRYKAVLERWPETSLWIRDSAMKNVAPVPRRMTKFTCDYQSSLMTDTFGQLNGSNSGTVALNFALQMDPDQIYLLGFDMQKGPNGEPYWYPPYPWAIPQGGTSPGKYKTWAQEFTHIAEQLKSRTTKITNVNHRSAITQFPTISWETFLAEI